jgi:hypothetical protein
VVYGIVLPTLFLFFGQKLINHGIPMDQRWHETIPPIVLMASSALTCKAKQRLEFAILLFKIFKILMNID